MRQGFYIAGLIVLFVFVAWLVQFGFRSPARGPAVGAEWYATHHRGIALLERREFAAAEEEFLKLTEAFPDDFACWMNLGISQLNQAEKGVNRAEQSFLEARRLQPDSPRAVFCLGLIYRFGERLGEACAEFERCLELAPDDADVHYRHAVCLIEADRQEEAIPHLEAALARNGELEAAWYRLSRLYMTLGREADATRAREMFQTLKETGRGDSRDWHYLEMGKLSEAIVDWAPQGEKAVAEQIPLLLADPVELDGTAPFALVDLDLDGVPSLWIGGPGAAEWSLVDDPARVRPLPELERARTFAVADFNEDGIPDVVTGAEDGARVHAVDAEGRLGKEERIPGADLERVWLLDLDLEGDVDLLGQRVDRAPGIAINQGRGFGRFDSEVELREVGTARRVLLARDLDGDGDAELLLAGQGVVMLIDNGPGWDLVTRPRDRRIPIQKQVHQIEAADFDGDGDDDLAVAGGAPGIYWNDGRGNFDHQATHVEFLAGAVAVEATDLDQDGHLDLVACQPGETRIARGLGRSETGSPLFRFEAVKLPGAVAVVSGDVDGDHDHDLIFQGADGTLRFVRNQTDASEHRVLVLYLGGVRDKSDRRTNLLGIGGRVEVRAGSLRRTETFQIGGARAQGLRPLEIGIGKRKRVDGLTVRWTDGVVQGEYEVKLDELVTIEEVQRKASSCPVLFTWDGQRYRFITDFMGGGGLGFWLGPDHYGSPDPTETVRIPPDALAPIDGEYRLSVMEPMQEVAYIDALRLRAVDHPAGVEVYPEEMFSTSGGNPSGRALYVDTRRRAFPVAAIGNGRDVRDALLEVDRRYAGPPSLDPDLVGFAPEQKLVLRFGDDLPREGTVALFLDGWVEYAYSRTNFAAHQGGRSLSPPTFSWRRAPEESWKLAGERIGYPAGMPKTMVLDVSEFVRAGATEFRIETDMEIYWDRIFAAALLPESTGRESIVPRRAALLRWGGYPREYSDDGALPPTYHYAERDPYLPYHTMAGGVTRYGEVGALLDDADDLFAIVAGADELWLRYDAAALAAPPEGWVRTFLLDTHGYCKDRDSLTGTGRTVDPLPWGAMTRYPPPAGENPPDRTTYRREWNTRQD